MKLKILTLIIFHKDLGINQTLNYIGPIVLHVGTAADR